jgi:hypothetical protein
MITPLLRSNNSTGPVATTLTFGFFDLVTLTEKLVLQAFLVSNRATAIDLP